MEKRPLWVYVTGVLVVLVVVNYVAWLTGGDMKLHTSVLVSFGFLLGMLAMYLAMHLYSWK